jgi:hypothetical protein
MITSFVKIPHTQKTSLSKKRKKGNLLALCLEKPRKASIYYLSLTVHENNEWENPLGEVMKCMNIFLT